MNIRTLSALPVASVTLYILARLVIFLGAL